MAKEKKEKKPRGFDLHAFLVGKLRAASRKWPPYNQVKNNAKVSVVVEYIEKDGKKWLKSTVDGTGEVVWTQVYKKMSNRERVMFRCACCGRLHFDYEFVPTKKGGLKKASMLARDHIDPVQPLDRELTGWDEFIARLFCDISNLQILCKYSGTRDGKKSCHDIKSAEEAAIRAKHRAEKKALQSDTEDDTTNTAKE